MNRTKRNTKLIQCVEKKASKQNVPMHGTFEILERCNLNCKMCYIRKPKNSCSKELSGQEWVQIARDAVNNGMLFLILTGGEIFLRSDFWDIYFPIAEMGIVLTLFTNGTLLTKEKVKRLAEFPPNRVEVTIYGASPLTYEKITGSKEGFKKCVRGIELLIEHNIPVVIKTTLTKCNIHDLEKMRKMANSWGVPFVVSWLLFKRLDGNNSNIEDCRLPPDYCIDIEGTDPELVCEWKKVTSQNLIKNRNKNFYCQAGKTSFTINPRGEMNPCRDLPVVSAKPLDIGFKNAWNEVRKFVDSISSISSICKECEFFSYCPRCPAWSFLETKSFDNPVPYLCEIAKKRKQKYETLPKLA